MVSYLSRVVILLSLTVIANGNENSTTTDILNVDDSLSTQINRDVNSSSEFNFTDSKDFRTFTTTTVQSIVSSTESSSSDDFSTKMISDDDDDDTSPDLSTIAPLVSEILSPSSTSKPEITTPDVLGKWLHFENITKIVAKGVVKSILPGLMEGSGKLNISDSCRRDVLKLVIGIRDIKTWAFSFIDASGKMIDGVLSGTMSALGDYDQCLDIKATNPRRGKRFGEVMFTGKYCALDIQPPLPPKPRYYKLNEVVKELREFASGDNIINEAAKAAQFFRFLTMRVGLCVPSGCKPSDLQQLLDIVEKDIYWTVKVNRCEVKQDNEFTPLIIGVITLMSFFGFLMLVGTMVDLYHKHYELKISSLALEILACFSLISNFKKLVNTRSSEGPLSCLNGFRFLSISWVILGHTYLNFHLMLAKSLRNATFFQKDFFFQAIVNATVAVDSFFFIGGFLVCYVAVKVVRESGKPFNIFLYILHRLFRILPVYIMVIAFIFLSPIAGSGPVYQDTVGPFLDACYKNWWTNLLFVNNFVHTNQICLPQSWYVACDMQLYVAALLVILPILRWPWVGLSIASLGVVASVVGTGIMTYVMEYPPTMLFIHPDIEQRNSYWANAYFKPYSHAGPYCIGLIAGYVLATHPKLKFSPMVRAAGWCMAIVSNMSVLYGVFEWNVGRDPGLAETLLYSSLHRVAWTFGVAWVVINCTTGQGGVVNYILSWKAWVPLGRLTYTLYLIHPIVQIAAAGNSRILVMTAHYFAVWIFFGHLMITIGSSFVTSMLVEAPFISLEKIILRYLVGKPSDNNISRPALNNQTDAPAANGNGVFRNGHAKDMNGFATTKDGDSEFTRNPPYASEANGTMNRSGSNGSASFSRL